MPDPRASGAEAGDRPAGRRVSAVLGGAVVVAGLAGAAFLGPGAGAAVRWLRGPEASPLWLSLRVAAGATVVAGVAGTACGYLLAKGRFAGRDLLEAVAGVPIILPPTVVGYYLLHVLGDSPTGRFLTRVTGGPLLFNATACTIAAAVAAFPFCLRAARAACAGVDPAPERAARAMGLPEWRVATTVTLPLARREITAGVTLGFVRALGEYGATLMVGGDIFGRTRTMPIAVADAVTAAQTRTLVAILVTVAVVAIAVITRLGRGAP